MRPIKQRYQEPREQPRRPRATNLEIQKCVVRQHGFVPETAWIEHCRQLCGVVADAEAGPSKRTIGAVLRRRGLVGDERDAAQAQLERILGLTETPAGEAAAGRPRGATIDAGPAANPRRQPGMPCERKSATSSTKAADR